MLEDLMVLIEESTGVEYGGEYGDVTVLEEIDISDEEIERIACHLIANGVKIPVLCKDCTHTRKAIDEKGHGIFCSILGREWHRVEPDDFCSYGERKDNG